MKVCVILSSPRRKGNSALLGEQFAKGAKEAGHEIEMIYLSSYDIQPCLACEYCRHHDHQCIRKDDADQVISKMIEADIWVLATPCYFYSVSAQMKLLMDRFFAREYEIREAKKRKQVYYIVTSGASGMENMQGVMESLRGFVKVLRTIDEAGVIDGTGAFQLGDAKSHPAFQKAYEMGKSILKR